MCYNKHLHDLYHDICELSLVDISMWIQLLSLTLWVTMWGTKADEYPYCETQKIKYQISKLSNVSNKLHITSKWFVSWRLWLNGSDNWYFNVDSTIVTHIVGHNMRDESRLVWPHLWSSALLILQDKDFCLWSHCLILIFWSDLRLLAQNGSKMAKFWFSTSKFHVKYWLNSSENNFQFRILDQ